jgi:phosphate/sulfate permease
VSQERTIDIPRVAAAPRGAAGAGAIEERRGGLNRDTVVKLLIAWTVTPLFAGAVAALAYFVISKL